jgi:hypothetical protein
VSSLLITQYGTSLCLLLDLYMFTEILVLLTNVCVNAYFYLSHLN